MKFFQNAIENVECKNFAIPNGLSEWLIANFQRNPDKNIKRAVVLTYKELVVQFTNLKGHTAQKDCLATVLNTGKKAFSGEFTGL